MEESCPSSKIYFFLHLKSFYLIIILYLIYKNEFYCRLQPCTLESSFQPAFSLTFLSWANKVPARFLSPPWWRCCVSGLEFPCPWFIWDTTLAIVNSPSHTQSEQTKSHVRCQTSCGTWIQFYGTNQKHFIKSVFIDNEYIPDF